MIRASLLSLVFFLLLIGGPVLAAPANQPTGPANQPTGPANQPIGPANQPTGGPSLGLQNPLKNINSLPELMNAILKALIDLGVIVLTLMLVYVGLKFVLARGNAEEIKSARTALMWTVIGGLILLGATGISKVIEATAQSL